MTSTTGNTEPIRIRNVQELGWFKETLGGPPQTDADYAEDLDQVLSVMGPYGYRVEPFPPRVVVEDDSGGVSEISALFYENHRQPQGTSRANMPNKVAVLSKPYKPGVYSYELCD